MDAYGNEIITKEELEASHMANMIKSFYALGSNKSGVVTKSDFIVTFVTMHLITKDKAYTQRVVSSVTLSK